MRTWSAPFFGSLFPLAKGQQFLLARPPKWITGKMYLKMPPSELSPLIATFTE